MPQKKKVSPTIAKAKVRISGMKTIDPMLDFGNGMNITAYEAAIQDAEQRIEAYNMAIATVSQLQSSVAEAEAMLAELSERMLSTIAGRYGKKSDQYEMAGGTKRSARRRVAKKKTEPAAPVSVAA
jgi:hypothetical protein